MSYENRITVIQVFRLMNIDPSPNVTWSVGNRVREMYREEFGEYPPKDNRPKTYGPGSHCFALYPETWLGKIKSVIREIKAAEDNQMILFGVE